MPKLHTPRRARSIVLAVLTAGTSAVTHAGAQSSAAPLAIVDVTIVDGTTPDLRRGWTVVVRDGRIVQAGPSRAVNVPRGARLVRGAGRYLVPGFWDMHVHLDGKDVEWLPLLVAHGVTSVRDVGSLRRADADSMLRIADARGFPAPRIETAGFVVETPSSLAFMERLATLAANTPHPTPRWHRGRIAVTSLAGADAVADSTVAARGTMLKFIDPGSPEVFFALARAARQRGLTLVGHAPQAFRTVGPWAAVDSGQRSFEHAFGLARALDTMTEASRAALGSRMRQRNAALVPTLLVSGQDMIPTDRFWTLVNDSVGAIDPRNRWISAQERTQWAVRLGMLRDSTRPRSVEAFVQQYRREAEALGVLHRVGAPILPGTDLGMYLVYPGSSLHEELALLARDARMTPYEVLRSATVESARWMGMADSLGTIRVGQVADLVLLDGDPTADVANLARIHAVVRAGQVFDAEALGRLRSQAVPGGK